MKFRKASAVFFCAALSITPTANADAVEIEETAEIRSLSGSADYAVAEGAKLTVRQEIDGEYAGTISGKGFFVKTGDANLTLTGTLALASGAVSVEAGALTFGDGVKIAKDGEFVVRNNGGTVILASNGDFASKLSVSSDSAATGTVISNGAGTTTVESLAGNLLRVNAGTLAVELGTSFNSIEVLSGAALHIGTGTSASIPSLSGNVSLESGATLVFNRAAISGESGGSYRYGNAISGEGDVVFAGTREFYFTGNADQTYTGTTTIDAGGMIFRQKDSSGNFDAAAKPVTLHSKKITVNGGNGGLFGGNVTVKGDVHVGGTEFSSVADWTGAFGENTFGAWHLGAGSLIVYGGDTLTIQGALKIESTSLTLNVSEDGASYDYSGNSGGAVRVAFDANGAGKIVATGDVELGGTLILTGAENLTAGQVAVFFESDPGKTSGTFDRIVYGSDNVTLLLPGVGGIAEGQLGIATTENRNVRKRASFREHEGLGEFVDYLVANADGANKVAQAVSLAGASSVTDVVNGFSPLAYCALPEMAMRQSDSELDMILQEIARAKQHPPESQDGVRVPANFTFFSGLVTDFIDHESDTDKPVYDFNAIGVFAGGHTWIDDERMAGFSLGAHRSSANVHGNGGTLDDAALRAKIFAVFAPKFANWHLTVGGTLGIHYYDIERRTALGNNTGTTDGVDAGIFAAFDYRSRIDDRLFFTPYLRFEYNFSYVGGLEESGSASRLDLRRVTCNTYRARFGAGVEYTASEEKTFGVRFGFVGTFGENMKLSSGFVEYDGSRTTVKGSVAEPMVFELAPYFGLKLGDGWTMDAAFRVQSSFSGSLGQSFGIGLSKQF